MERENGRTVRAAHTRESVKLDTYQPLLTSHPRAVIETVFPPRSYFHKSFTVSSSLQ